MTTRDLAPDRPGSSDGTIDELFAASPERQVRTSAAAEIAFLAGTVAALGSPFSLCFGLTILGGALGLVVGVLGLARASRPATSGTILASTALVLSLLALAVVALRYAGIDTAVGDPLVPTIHDALRSLTDLFPTPGS